MDRRILGALGALAITLGAPVIAVERAHHAGNRVVEVSDIVIPAGRYKLRYRIPADRAEWPARAGAEESR